MELDPGLEELVSLVHTKLQAVGQPVSFRYLVDQIDRRFAPDDVREALWTLFERDKLTFGHDWVIVLTPSKKH